MKTSMARTFKPAFERISSLFGNLWRLPSALASRFIRKRIPRPDGETSGTVFDENLQQTPQASQEADQALVVPHQRLVFPETPRSENDEDENHVDQVEEGSDANAMVAIPDLAYEVGFRSAQLPRVAVKEIMNDMQLQAEDERVDRGRIAFELSGAHFNGHLADGSDLALNYLTRAIELGDDRARSCGINAFQSMNQSVPDSALNTVQTGMDHCGVTLLCYATKVAYSLQLPSAVDHKKVLLSTWRDQYRQDYESFLRTDERRSVNAETLLFGLSALREAPGGPDLPQNSEFFESAHLSYSTNQSDKLEEASVRAFMDEVRNLACINKTNENGLTLLQTAVCKDDLLLAQVLVEQMHADIENFGITPAWTPLWLSCFLGRFDMARLLVQMGANAASCDNFQQLTILHLLNQFSDESQVEEIAHAALEAGVDVNARNSDGCTPLFAALLAWDYTNGAAIKFLLDNSADPTHEATYGNDLVTPIGLAVQALDYDLLLSMIRVAPPEKLASAKAQAFRWLLRLTKFHLMCTVGAGFQQKLTSIVQVLLDSDMCKAFTASRLGEPHITPFVASTLAGRGHLVQAILTASPETPLSVSRHPRQGRWRALNTVIELRSKECVSLMLQHGANILERNDNGANALHKAAVHFPEIILDLIKAVEHLPSDSRDGRSVKDILEITDKGGYTLFGLLVAEGYSLEREIAEGLRTQYELEYDSPTITGNFTLTAALIAMAVWQGLIDATPIKYLLNLSSLPRFELPGGLTLLHMTVSAPIQRPSYYNATVTEILRVILRKYPGYENLIRGPDGYTPLHRAAEASNVPALRLLQRHIKNEFPDRPVPYNLLCRNYTVLDYAYLSTENSYLDRFEAGSNQAAVTEHTKRMHQDLVYEFFKALREDGALHRQELKGVYLLAHYLPANLVPHDEFYKFLDETTTQSYIGHWKYETDPIILKVRGNAESGTNELVVSVSDPAIPTDTDDVLRGFEFVWLYDHFCLRGYEVHVSRSPAIRAAQVAAHTDQRREDSCYFGYALRKTFMGPGGTLNLSALI
ncbi:hypothetical protein LTS12_003302 [Elasticomyces elasticus]|nr:hypothetical protein LTS12_003302 [Elasticomyces elasticus]